MLTKGVQAFKAVYIDIGIIYYNKYDVQLFWAVPKKVQNGHSPQDSRLISFCKKDLGTFRLCVCVGGGGGGGGNSNQKFYWVKKKKIFDLASTCMGHF